MKIRHKFLQEIMSGLGEAMDFDLWVDLHVAELMPASREVLAEWRPADLESFVLGVIWGGLLYGSEEAPDISPLVFAALLLKAGDR